MKKVRSFSLIWAKYDVVDFPQYISISILRSEEKKQIEEMEEFHTLGKPYCFYGKNEKQHVVFQVFPCGETSIVRYGRGGLTAVKKRAAEENRGVMKAPKGVEFVGGVSSSTMYIHQEDKFILTNKGKWEEFNDSRYYTQEVDSDGCCLGCEGQGCPACGYVGGFF